MRRRILALSLTLIAVGVVVLAVTWATADRRTRDALERLNTGAARLHECRIERRSFDGCQSGETQVHNFVDEDGFELRAGVFGVGTFVASAREDDPIVRSCEARGTHCRNGHWAADTK